MQWGEFYASFFNFLKNIDIDMFQIAYLNTIFVESVE